MTFTVVKKGEEITFESAFSALEIAKYYLQENLSYNTFASDLTRKAKLTEKQIAWVHYLATEHLTKELNEENTSDEVRTQFANLVKQMYAKIKTNSRTFKVRPPGEVMIATVNKGQNQGALYLYENQEYIGKITTEGELKLKEQNEDVINLLKDANENILKLAQLYGHTTGVCAICARTLSDPLSVQMGIGPVCAKRFS